MQFKAHDIHSSITEDDISWARAESRQSSFIITRFASGVFEHNTNKQ
jgi:hypothetical protein